MQDVLTKILTDKTVRQDESALLETAAQAAELPWGTK
jgi:hypothetical protein